MAKPEALRDRIDLTRTNRKPTGDRTPVSTGSDEQRTPGTPRVKAVRVTSDLSPREYRNLTQFCATLAEDLGRARVPLVEVHRALLAELEASPDLATRVAERIEQQIRN